LLVKEQPESLIELARKIEADESGEPFENTFKNIIPPKMSPFWKSSV
jgi:hypothetical protein